MNGQGGTRVVTRNGRTIAINPPGTNIVVNIPSIPELLGAGGSQQTTVSTVDPDLVAMVSSLPRHYLIINDHPDLRSAAVRDRVAQIGAALVDLGLQPLANSDLEATLDARIRTEVSRVGEVDIENNNVTDAEQIIGSLLGSDEQLADLGCVVWIARGSRDNILTWVMTPDCLHSDIDNEILGYLSMSQ